MSQMVDKVVVSTPRMAERFRGENVKTRMNEQIGMCFLKLVDDKFIQSVDIKTIFRQKNECLMPALTYIYFDLIHTVKSLI